MSLQNGYQIPNQSSMSSRGPQTLQNITQSLPNGPPPSSSLASLVSPLNTHHGVILGSTSNAMHGPGVSAPPQAAPDAMINSDVPVKRGPGRPKGSTNKNKPPLLNPDGTLIPKRPVGRPRKEVDPNAPVKPKNPVGRPRKHPLPPDSDNTTPNERTTQPSASTSAATSAATTSYVGQHQLNAPPGANSARLAPSPTLASATSLQGQSWPATNGPNAPANLDPSVSHMNPGYRPMPNGHVNSHGHLHGQQIQRTNQTPSTLATSSASSSAHFHSPQITVYDALTLDPDLNGVLDSPLLHASQPPTGPPPQGNIGRKPPSPALTPTIPHPQTHRHLAPPQSQLSASAAQPGQTQLSTQNTPAVPPRHFTGTPRQVKTPPNWEQLEASIWKEIQSLNFVNPRVVVENAKSRSADATALRRTVPPDVYLAYTDHLRELRRETPAGCPDAYTILNSFWLPGIASYFHLTTSRSTVSTPPCNYRFFYWDPMYLLVGGIPCPHCSSQLVRDGFHGPCPVITLGDPFYLVGQIYKCTTCSRRQEGPAGGLYLSWDEGILKSLPDPLAKEFPAYNMTWGSFSNELRDLVRSMAKEGMEPKNVANVIRSVSKPGGSAVQESPGTHALESPVTTPASPELPERQRIYYQAWHRNGRLPQSLVPSGGSPLQMNANRAGLSEPFLADDEMRTVEQLVVDPALKRADAHVLGTPAPMGNPPINRSPRPSTSSSMGKPPSLKAPSKTAISTTPGAAASTVPGGGNGTVPPASVMPPSLYFVPPGAVAGVRYFQPPAMPPGVIAPFYPGGPPPTAIPTTSSAPVPPSTPPTNSNGGGETLRRANPYSETETPSPKKRRVRHCAKCGSPTCKGRGGGSNCPNPCRDCHKVECKGRSSTKPGRVCDTAAATSSLTD